MCSKIKGHRNYILRQRYGKLTPIQFFMTFYAAANSLKINVLQGLLIMYQLSSDTGVKLTDELLTFI